MTTTLRQANSNFLFLVPFEVLLAVNTSIEDSHRLISRSRLNLHVIRFMELTLGTRCLRPVCVLPRFFTTKYVFIKYFSLAFDFSYICLCDVVFVHACRTAESHHAFVAPFYEQKISATRTEMHTVLVF